MKKRPVKIVLALVLWVLSIAASLSGTNTSTNYIMPESFILDFGEASVNVIVYDESFVQVSYTQRAAQQGLQGTVVASESSLTLIDYAAPVRQENPVAYRVDPWLPLVQLSSYREPFLGLSEADYTIYVPKESILDIRGRRLTVIGGTLQGLCANEAVVTGSNLKDGFVAEVGDLVLRGGSSEGSVYIEGAYTVIRNLNGADMTVYAAASADVLDLEIRDTVATNVVVEATDKTVLRLTMQDVDFASLSVGHSGAEVYSTFQNARIAQIYDNTAVGLSGR